MYRIDNKVYAEPKTLKQAYELRDKVWEIIESSDVGQKWQEAHKVLADLNNLILEAELSVTTKHAEGECNGCYKDHEGYECPTLAYV